MSDPSIKKACCEVKKYMSDEAQFMKYFNQEMNELDIAAEKTAAYDDGRLEGREEGREEGAIKTRIQTVLNLLRKGMNLGFIKDVTNSSDDEIYSVAKQYGLQVK